MVLCSNALGGIEISIFVSGLLVANECLPQKKIENIDIHIDVHMRDMLNFII